MAAKIIGLVIGILVLAAGVYYLGKEKNDPESRKIYGVISAVGGVVAVVCALLIIILKNFNPRAPRGARPQ